MMQRSIAPASSDMRLKKIEGFSPSSLPVRKRVKRWIRSHGHANMNRLARMQDTRGAIHAALGRRSGAPTKHSAMTSWAEAWH